MSLRKEQSEFARHIPFLILYAYSLGYEVTIGDVWARDGHSKNSKHYDKLAIDINLFKNGVYLTETYHHKPLGEFWKSLNPNCTWGGDFKRKDGNHYSWGEF